MTGNLLRNWFVPRDGISREVISADIQRFLGNDATVRPGKEVINGKEVRKLRRLRWTRNTGTDA